MARKVARKERARTQSRQSNTPLIIGGVAIAVIAVGLLILLNVNLSSSAKPISIPAGSAGKTLGKPDAQVTIDEFADFQCPICGQADRTIQQLVPQYFDTGKAKVVFHNYAFIGPESQWAAEAADCAMDQNKFWEYADYVFTHQAGENKGAFSKDNLKGFAVQVGLDTAAFNTCFDSGKYTDSVKQEKTQGDQLGIQATPTFFIKGQKFEGVPSNFGSLINSYTH